LVEPIESAPQDEAMMDALDVQQRR